MSGYAGNKIQLVLGFISQDLADSMRQLTEDIEMELKCVNFKKIDEFLRLARTSDAVFLQWDGRANIAHDLLAQWSKGHMSPRGPIYIVTASNIKIDPLPPKILKQLSVSGWFDVPAESDKLKADLVQIIPDRFDDPGQDIKACDLEMLPELDLPQLRGRHLIGEITAAWEARAARQKQASRIRDEAHKPHLTVFAPKQSLVNEITTFMKEGLFKNFDGFSDTDAALRFLRGHSTDAIVAWYDGASRATEDVLLSYLENRTAPSIPVIIIYQEDPVVKLFQDRCPRTFVTHFMPFDRSRENFRYGILEALKLHKSESHARHLLEDIRSPAKDALAGGTTGVQSTHELEVLCDRLAAEPGKTYWADAEKLLGYARLRELEKYDSQLTTFANRYTHFDAQLLIAVTRCQISKDDTPAAARGFLSKLPMIQGLNADRLYRVGAFFHRAGAKDSLKALLVFWWEHQERFPIDHQFLFLASRYALLGHYTSLERCLLAAALRGDPLRTDYVEAYAQHLAVTNHPGHVINLGEFLLQNPQFSRRKCQNLLLDSHIKLKNYGAALSLVNEMLILTPTDKSLLALQSKCAAFPRA